MKPRTIDDCAASRPRGTGLLPCALLALLAALIALPDDAEARKKRRRKPAARPAPAKPTPTPAPAPAPDPVPAADDDDRKPAGKGKMQELDFRGLDLSGHKRTPQLLYFLERASAELEAASLERRSFIPDMLRSLEEERL